MEDFFLPITFTSTVPVLAGITTGNAGNAKFPEKKREIARRLNIADSGITTGEQVHKNGIAIVREKDRGRKFPATDGLITDLPNVPLAIFVADCPPIFLFHPQRKIAGLLHAGWRSTVTNISSMAVNMISHVFGVKARDILAVIGPHICKECYTVSWSPVAKAFTECFKSWGREVLASIISESSPVSQEKFWSVDLAKANSYQLQRAGIVPKNIQIMPMCTYENENFFSYRRDKTSTGRMMAIIQLNFS
ncbi:peptidoglycan editing factor PgeF [bacterium]|nr:peptidoglycan editing factor PgeF [bacterium]NIN92367.1 peptidoglycan editing factor PgeF [bacterium]NIO18481.1 peptidoglycan editing factor PgeF [bacterium]NIO73477.1 peptidoglycan editing factor PgeF [bacterium]